MRSALVGPGVVAIAGLRRPLTFSFSQVAVILSGKVGEGRLPCRSRRFNRSAARATRLSAAAAYLPARCYDVVVVGAGIMGACTAAELATTGNSVLLLEQFDLLHRRGSSHGESRITRPTYPESYYTAMMKQAFGLWKAAQREASMSVYTRCGGLDFGSSDSKAMGSLMESVRENHVEHEVLSPSLVRKRHPMLKLPSDYIAIANKDAGVLNATKSVAMFLQLCRSRGADIRDRSPVETISTTDGPGSPVRIMLADGSTVECAKLVLTAGPWAGKMLKRISIAGDRPLVTAPPLQPIHCTVAFWKAKYPELFQPGRFPIWIHYDDDEWNTFYGFPILEMPGCLKIDLHGGPPCDPDNRHFGPGMDELTNHVAPFIRKYFDGVADSPTFAEGCVYTMTPDSNFILDVLPENRNIVVGAGFSGHGFKLAPLVGRVLAQLALDEKSDVDLFVVSRKIWSLGRSSAASARDCALPFQKAGMDCEDLLSSSSKSA